jgi:RNA polymerase sigma-70 factor, ECF subfamily
MLARYEDTDDRELIAQGRLGDQEAIGELIERHYSSSLHVARGILRNPEDAQDAVQVAYFTAVRNLDKFRGESSFKTWVGRIVVNCCLLQMRKGKRSATWVRLDGRDGRLSVEQLASHSATPERSAWCSELSCAFSLALAHLPEPLREAYVTAESSEMSQAEVAAALGLTISATKTRLFRARARLRSSLRPLWSSRRNVA